MTHATVQNNPWPLERFLRHLLGVFLFLLPWQTIWIYEERFVGESKWELATMGYYATELLLWFTVIVFLLWFWKKKRNNLFGSRMHFSWSADRVYAAACAVFIFYAFLSSAWSMNPDIAWQHAMRLTLAVTLFFMLFIGPLCTKKAVCWFVAGAAVQSVLGILQFATQNTFSSAFLGLSMHTAWEAGTSVVASDTIGRWLRAYGSFPHPNILGGYLVVSLFFTTWLSNQVHIFHSKSTIGIVLKLIGFSLLFDIQIIALILTFSRGAWIAFALFVVGLFFGSLYRGYKFLLRLSVYMMALVAIMLIIFSPIVVTRLRGNSISEQRSITERVHGYEQSLSVMRDHPWLGVGVGGYTATLHERDSSLPGWQLQPVHNTALLFVAEVGGVGLVLYLSVLCTFIKFQYASVRRDKRAVVRHSYALAYIFYSLLFLTLIAFDHYWFSSYVGLMLTMIYWAIVFRSIRDENEVLC